MYKSIFNLGRKWKCEALREQSVKRSHLSYLSWESKLEHKYNYENDTNAATSVIQNQIQLQRKERVGGFKRAISGEVSLSLGEHNK